MKRRVQKTDEKIAYAGILYLDDIKRIMKILSDDYEDVVLSTNDYEEVATDDLDRLFEETRGQIKSMEIRACKHDNILSSFSVDFDSKNLSLYGGKARVWIRIDDSDSSNALGAAQKIKKILKQRKRKYYNLLVKFIASLFIILYTIVLSVFLVLYHQYIGRGIDGPLPAFFYFLAIVAGFFIWGLYDKTLESLFLPLVFLRNQKQNCWKRYKGQILVGLLLVVVSAILHWVFALISSS